jgi:hypothetical protein
MHAKTSRWKESHVLIYSNAFEVSVCLLWGAQSDYMLGDESETEHHRKFLGDSRNGLYLRECMVSLYLNLDQY